MTPRHPSMREQPSPLEEIHPGWILEKLEGESPRVFGILCRFLPGDKVRYLIDHMTPGERKLLPKVVETYKVPSEIADLVCSLIEKKLSLSLPSSPSGPFSFIHIPLMKSDDLRTLFWDLGLEEIRKGFSRVDPKVLKAFLARFSPAVAKEIRGRLDFGEKVSAGEREAAQSGLASLAPENLSAEELFREIGYSVFARATTAEDRAMAETVCQKIPPPEGHRLKRIITETGWTQTADFIRSIRESILGRITLLAEKGLIRRYWKTSGKGKIVSGGGSPSGGNDG